MIEHELKFALTASMAAEFEQRAAIGLVQAPQRLWSQYFDTPAGDLMAASATLRVRRTPGGHVQTVKAAGRGAFERYEWEAAVAGAWPEFDALPPPDHPVGTLLRECFGLLAPVFETDFERQVRLVRPQPGVTLEIACDRGEIRAGPRSERIAEVEIERKEGSAAAFYHFSTQWAALHQAELLLGTKGLRGLQLAGRQPDRPQAVELQPRTTEGSLAEAAREMLSAHLDHFLANLPAVLSDTGPAGVHRLCTALRRFRAALRFLGLHRQPLPGDGGPAGGNLSFTWKDLDARARLLVQAASPVRQADLCEAGLLAGVRHAFPEDAAVRLLGHALESSRERERAALRRTMTAPDVTVFVMRAHAAVAALPSDRWPDQTFAAFAAGRLAALARRAGRRVRCARPPQQSHEAGVSVARLRWALEACRALQITAGPAEEMLASLAPGRSNRESARQVARARLILVDALARTHASTEAAARAVALVDGWLACARWLDDPDALRAPLLATIDRVLDAQKRSRRSGNGNHGKGDDKGGPPAQAGEAPDALTRGALRLSS